MSELHLNLTTDGMPIPNATDENLRKYADIINHPVKLDCALEFIKRQIAGDFLVMSNPFLTDKSKKKWTTNRSPLLQLLRGE